MKQALMDGFTDIAHLLQQVPLKPTQLFDIEWWCCISFYRFVIDVSAHIDISYIYIYIYIYIIPLSTSSGTWYSLTNFWSSLNSLVNLT